MTHVIRYEALPDGLTVQSYREADNRLVIIVNATLSRDERRAAVAAALQASRQATCPCPQ